LLHRGSTTGLMTLRLHVDARTVEEAGGLAGHDGEEFCYVLSGTLELHFKGAEPTRLTAGDSVLFASHQPHAYVGPTAEGATLLLVLSNPREIHGGEQDV
jgi:quercetin dioxygenase-like cupin family protein